MSWDWKSAYVSIVQIMGIEVGLAVEVMIADQELKLKANMKRHRDV